MYDCAVLAVSNHGCYDHLADHQKAVDRMLVIDMAGVALQPKCISVRNQHLAI